MYFSYTTTVLLADIWHRKITLPKREARPLLAEMSEETVIPDVEINDNSNSLLAPASEALGASATTNGNGHEGQMPTVDTIANQHFSQYEQELRSFKGNVNPFGRLEQRLRSA